MVLLNYETMVFLVDFIGILFAYAGIVVMIVGGAKALYLLVYRWIVDHTIPMGKIRIKLGHYLVLSLEFLVAKDILESIVDPTANELIVLGSIVLIRTVLSYFLNKEIAEVKEEMAKQTEENTKNLEKTKIIKPRQGLPAKGKK